MPEPPLLIRRPGREGAPAPVYFTLQQMRAAGIPYGAPASGGGVRLIQLHEIQNMDTLAHLQWLRQRYPQAELKTLVPDTAIYKYGETIANQAGYRVVGVEVDTTNAFTQPADELTRFYSGTARARAQRGMTSGEVQLEHQQILDRFNVDSGTPLLVNFDILLRVEPW